MYFMLIFIMLILVTIMIMLSVAFLTLMERKLLSYIQIRIGPNKIGFIGLLQPFSDAIKLISKEMILLKKVNYFYYFFSPMFMLILMLMMWMIYPFYTNLYSLELNMIYLMCCLSMGGYGMLISGWSSNSFYSMMGAIRSLSQSISYEVNLSIMILMMLFLIESFNLNLFLNLNMNLMNLIYFWPLSLLFFFTLMAELNRTPFDFSEGESELVSGFNTEYMSGGFILIFLSEYMSILFLSFLFCMFYISNYSNMMFYIYLMVIIFLIIWIRGTMPRFRYDLLMYLCWLIILPFVLNYMYYLILIKFLIYKLS
uniref:NADH-ubiquinone oxidoreductase chain 1 n=1 Tax=Diadegma semiclausum TaxID=208481 RepID=C4N030_DIASM|nr:NADH dehydrogenase subunit 1 [Diadegma semiclausum]ACF35068.1 NADH dehydrogenase subunit 1 [Diadegma semiclausum]